MPFCVTSGSGLMEKSIMSGEDEVVADFVSYLVRDKHAFETFLENKSKGFIQRVIDVFESIFAYVSSRIAHNKEVKALLASLHDLAAVAAEAVEKGAKTEDGKPRQSLQNNVSAEELAEREVPNIVLEDTSDQKLPSSREEAFEHIPQGGISIFNGDIDANIKVGRKAVKHTALHHQKDEYSIFAGIQQIVANAVKVGNIPVAEDEIGHTHSVSIMYVPINVNGTQYSARLLVKELENKGVVLEELSLYNVSMHKERGSAIQPLNASDEVGGITAKPQSFYKVKELIHNSQEIDKKNLGINEVTRFSLITPEMDVEEVVTNTNGDVDAIINKQTGQARLSLQCVDVSIMEHAEYIKKWIWGSRRYACGKQVVLARLFINLRYDV